MAVTEEQVWEALRDCYDPEIPVNVVDLGLVYEVKIIDDWVGVKMTLTAPGCALHGLITKNIRNRLLQIPGVKDAEVRLVFEPQWQPNMMSEEAKKILNWQG